MGESKIEKKNSGQASVYAVQLAPGDALVLSVNWEQMNVTEEREQREIDQANDHEITKQKILKRKNGCGFSVCVWKSVMSNRRILSYEYE